MFILAGWVNRHQQAVIEYLQAENQALREQRSEFLRGKMDSERTVRVFVTRDPAR